MDWRVVTGIRSGLERCDWSQRVDCRVVTGVRGGL